eukprot:TRINITY_DN101566_c0_g1_i1.p1 TRINITY_DN101566_c0_g1~~TRINITY_DN101566_c0_g1_i1.p1  ORF type:complete len:431 (-),score=43.92 TRINITY_DN101566_c0_g1_i1:15-1214(-)
MAWNDFKWLSLAVFCVQNSASPIVFRYAMTETDAAHRPQTSVVLICTEVVKLILSFLLLCNEESWHLARVALHIKDATVAKPAESMQLLVPAAIYALQNALLQWSSGHLSAAVWQVTYQGKILVTAVFSVVLLRKVIKRVQWLAMGVMGLGIAIVQLSNAKEKAQEDMANSAEQDVTRGFTMLILAACCSGFASVYTELVFKQVGAAADAQKLSVWLQNMRLAVFSCLMLLLSWAFEVTFPKDEGKPVATDVSAVNEFNPLRGFTAKTWALAVSNAVGGLLVALVIKHADNLLRGFASAVATVNAAVLSTFCFGFVLAPSFAVGSLLVIGSTLLYGNILKLPGEWWNSELKLLSAGTPAAGKPSPCEPSQVCLGKTAPAEEEKAGETDSLLCNTKLASK